LVEEAVEEGEEEWMRRRRKRRRRRKKDLGIGVVRRHFPSGNRCFFRTFFSIFPCWAEPVV
jgi:hypothetical protein